MNFPNHDALTSFLKNDLGPFIKKFSKINGFDIDTTKEDYKETIDLKEGKDYEIKQEKKYGTDNIPRIAEQSSR